MSPKHTPMPFSVLSSLAEAQRVLSLLQHDTGTLAAIDQALAALTQSIKDGGKILAVGNGGSCCDAAHFTEELTGRFRNDRPPIAAVACNDAGHLTCTANDYGYEHVFSRWVRGLARPGDIVVILSTSGNSPNCVHAARAAKEAGARTLGLLGKGGGTLASHVDIAVICAGDTADRIQELHMLILHVLVEGLENALGYR